MSFPLKLLGRIGKHYALKPFISRQSDNLQTIRSNILLRDQEINTRTGNSNYYSTAIRTSRLGRQTDSSMPYKRLRSGKPKSGYRLRQGAKRPKRRYGRSAYRGQGANLRTGGYIGMENKFYDSKLVTDPLATNATMAGLEADPATVLGLNAVAQGDSESNRDGRQISQHSISVKGLVRIAQAIDQTTVCESPTVFIALVLDTQTNGAQLNSENVFVNPSANTVGCVQPFINLQFAQRFKVLDSVHFKMEQPQVGWDGTNIERGGMTHQFTLYKSLKGLRTNFKAATELNANITDNSLHLIACTSSVSCAPALTYNSRLRFSG